MLEENHNAAQQRDELIRTQIATLEQLLYRLNDMARLPPLPLVPAAEEVPNPRAANRIAPEAPRALA